MKKVFLFTLISTLTGLLWGCAETAPSRFYTLSAIEQPASVPFSRTVSLGPVLIPAVIDRPQMVTRLTPDEISIDEFHRWAVPLQKEISRVMAENLTRKLGSPRITVFPQFAPQDQDIRIIVDIVNLEAVAGVNVSLSAKWDIRVPGNDRVITGRCDHIEPAAGGYEERIAAYNRALRKLSDDLAAALLAL